MNKGLLILTLVLSTGVFAQTDKQLQNVADETCDCLKDKDLEDAGMNTIQMELGVCMLAAMGESGVDYDISDLNGIEKIGEQVGFKLALSCPEFMHLMGNYAEEDPEGFQELIDGTDDKYSSELSYGEVLEVNSGDFVTLKILDEDGKKMTFYWFEHFDGADLLENGGVNILKKDIFVEYEILEVYSPKMEDYTNIKVIRSLMLD